MGPESNASDVLLIPLDPLRGLQKVTDHLERYVDLDPKLREAARLLQERFDSLSASEQEVLGALLWAYLRGQIKASASVDAIIRWAGQGEAVLRTAEGALGSIFSTETLRASIREATRLTTTQSDTGAGAEIQQARDEIRQMTSVEILLKLGLLGGIGLGTLYYLAQGYTIEPPPPPPPPPPPDSIGRG